VGDGRGNHRRVSAVRARCTDDKRVLLVVDSGHAEIPQSRAGLRIAPRRGEGELPQKNAKSAKNEESSNLVVVGRREVDLRTAGFAEGGSCGGEFGGARGGRVGCRLGSRRLTRSLPLARSRGPLLCEQIPFSASPRGSSRQVWPVLRSRLLRRVENLRYDWGGAGGRGNTLGRSSFTRALRRAGGKTGMRELEMAWLELRK
jgi:hypothetical protein